MKCALVFAVSLVFADSAAFAESNNSPVRILFGGDVMLARYVRRNAERHTDPRWPFLKIADEFRAADIAFANLESPFAADGPYFEDRMVFRAQPEMIEGLKHAGVDVLSTANNHARDAGWPGIAFTLDLLAKNGIAAVGTAGQPAALGQGVVLERKGVRFGFLAYTFDQRNGNHPDDVPHVAMMDARSAAAEIQALRKRCDVVIVSMHAGYEYMTAPNTQQIQFARGAIDSGASVVVGHHPHAVQPAERYKDGVIFYSLGNLVFDQDKRLGAKEGAVGEVLFDGPKIAAYRLREIEIHDTVPRLR